MSPDAPTPRRLFLQTSAGAGLVAWLACVEKATASLSTATGDGSTLLDTLPFVGEGDFPLERTIGDGLGRRRSLDLGTLSPESLVVPRDRFFVRTAEPHRLPPASSWRIRVHGLVESPLELPIEELHRETRDEGLHLLECAGNSRALHFGLMGVAGWAGVRLERLLDRVRLRPGATQVLVSGFDEHQVQDAASVPGASWVFGLADLRGAGAFLATRMNGAPLGPDHGHPVRLLVPGWYACAAIKWVNEIAFLGDDAPATDHMREYAGRTHQDPVGPRDRALMSAGHRPEGPPRARDFRPATIDPAGTAVRVEKSA